MIISERLFEIMNEKEITQVEFSRATGIAQSTIADWKRKKTNPAADKIMMICDVLNVSPYELLQDSKRLKEGEIDYYVVSEGTDKFELLLEFDKLDNKQRERVMGFINALSGDH